MCPVALAIDSMLPALPAIGDALGVGEDNRRQLVITVYLLGFGIAQINAVVGDFPGNVKRILAAYRDCLDQGAELVITPEMSLA